MNKNIEQRLDAIDRLAKKDNDIKKLLLMCLLSTLSVMPFMLQSKKVEAKYYPQVVEHKIIKPVNVISNVLQTIEVPKIEYRTRYIKQKPKVIVKYINKTTIKEVDKKDDFARIQEYVPEIQRLPSGYRMNGKNVACNSKTNMCIFF